MEKQYYIASGKDHLGPFTLSQLRDKKPSAETLIWHDGLEQWTKAEDLEELKAQIPNITSPPLTPIQVQIGEKKIMSRISRVLLGKALKKSGIVLVLVSVIYTIVQYISLDNQAGYPHYAIKSEDVLSTALVAGILMGILISLIVLPLFYVIEKQKPYNDLLICTEKKDAKVYSRVIQQQEQRYIYDKELSSTPCIFGYILLGLSLLFGFFPEHMLFGGELEADAKIIVAFLTIGTRLVSVVYVAQQVENKNRSYLWVLLTLISPAIGLLTQGSLYPIRKANSNASDKDINEGHSNLSNDEENE